MKLVIQRVKSAKVTEHESSTLTGEINLGLFVLVGFKKEDTEKQVTEFVSKLLKIRIMSDESDKMNLSIRDINGEIIVVSQFTLMANTKDGNRPSFINSMEPTEAKRLYLLFIEKLRESGLNIQTGSFGKYMDIKLELDGPVTILMEN